MSMIQFRNVGFRYPNNMGETLVDLNFSIEARSFQFLTGPSGAGKTTLLRLILMMLLPTRGTITLFGQNLNNDVPPETVAALRRRIGIVFQENRLLDHLTVYENVSLPLLMIGKNEADYRA